MVHLSYLIFDLCPPKSLGNFDKSLNTFPIPQSDKLPFGSGEKVHFLLEELYQDLSSFEKTFPSELH